MSKVAPGGGDVSAGNCEGRHGHVHTSIVDEGVDVPMTSLDLLESFLDGLVTGEVEGECFDGVGRAWALLVEGLDREFGLLQGTTAEEDVVGPVGLEERLDGLVADATIGAGDYNYLWGCHRCGLASA